MDPPRAAMERMSFWDERYSRDEYVYGVAPNRWLASESRRIRPGGRVLSLGEGEGRNAVWLAERGFEVVAVDASAVGLEKARRLAASRGVTIQTHLEHLAGYRPEPASYDALVLVYLHLGPKHRAAVHAAGAAALKPGGVVIVEAFTPGQLAHRSGGPKQLDFLYDAATLRADLAGVSWDVLEELEIDLAEGPLHQGRAAVVRGVGQLGAAPARGRAGRD